MPAPNTFLKNLLSNGNSYLKLCNIKLSSCITIKNKFFTYLQITHTHTHTLAQEISKSYNMLLCETLQTVLGLLSCPRWYLFQNCHTIHLLEAETPTLPHKICQYISLDRYMCFYQTLLQICSCTLG